MPASPGIFGEGQVNDLGVGWFRTACTAAAQSAGVATTGVALRPNGCGGSTIQLTTAWSVQAAYEHFWTPSLRTSLVGAYTDISYNGDG